MNKRAYIEKYLANFEISPTDVGMYIAEGGQHYVFHYKDNQVIKFPKNTFLMNIYGMHKCQTMLDCNDLVSRIFGDYVIKSEVIPCKNHKQYLVIQDFIENGRELCINNFHKVKEEFHKVAIMNQELLKTDTMSHDFLGFFGFFKCLNALLFNKKQHAVIENVLVYEKNGISKLIIVDFNLFETKIFNNKINPIHWMVDQFFYRGSKFLIKRLFNENI